MSLRDNPREIALGFSLGLFVGMSPFFFFHTFLAILLASLLKWNKFSAAAGVFITNPVTAPFFYRFTWLVGSVVIPHDAHFHIPTEFSFSAFIQILEKTPEMVWILTVGGILTGIPLAIAGFYFSYWCIIRYRKV